ncbi:succinyl-diaminopimelate desuccinylase [Caminibacter mediatlanticus TB-2]|uniref:Succinyl-diaminopimelate desuccinylase n=1 Tax=Caminibacter mediatlanticus TB-2 TaxID=391592 RepID=A0ABX5VBE8_9BACT|nr:succinyl-diaminopimelate desuccinylase [Caminibacter mediatlanticus TB-2]
MLKVYELKKGDKILSGDEILEFEEIRGDKAIFYTSFGIEIEYPDFLNIEEIGEFIKEYYYYKEEDSTPSLF